MTKKQMDNLAVLNAQLDSARERLTDYYYRDQKEWLMGQIEKLEILIKRIKQ